MFSFGRLAGASVSSAGNNCRVASSDPVPMLKSHHQKSATNDKKSKAVSSRSGVNYGIRPRRRNPWVGNRQTERPFHYAGKDTWPDRSEFLNHPNVAVLIAPQQSETPAVP